MVQIATDDQLLGVLNTAHLLRDAAAFALQSTAAASAFVAVAAALFALLRTNSLHAVRTRVWRLLWGPAKCANEELVGALQDRDDLIQFRYFLGIPARTVKRVAAIAQWTRKNDEEPADVYDCDTLFDRERCRLKEERVPGRFGLAVRGVALMCALLYFVGPWFMLGLRSDQVLVPMDEKLTTWFWLSEKSARSAWGSEVLTPETCSYGVKADVPPWPDYAAVTNICNSFADPRLKSSIANIAALTDEYARQCALNALPTPGKVYLSWSATSDVAGVAYYTLVHEAGATPPADCTAGEMAYSGADRATHHSVAPVVYSYRLCATHTVGNRSEGAARTTTVP